MPWIVSSGLPVRTLPDLVEFAKARPGKVNYGSAGAGTGKTTVVVERVRHLLATDPTLQPENILVLTYNVRAAAELTRRLEKALGLERASRLWVHNFHSFGYGLLTSHRAELGLADSGHMLDPIGQRLLLGDLRPEVEFVDAAKIPYGPSKAQEEINRILVERALEGKFVVRLKGGDPYVFGRGGEEALACAAAGVPVLVVPGVTSSIAAPALAGIPVTHRGVAHEFTVVSGHVAPDSPQSLVDWPALGRLRGTIVVMMGLKNLPAIAARLIEEGRPAGTPVAVVQEGSTAHQRSLRSTLASVAEDVASAGLRPPATVVIGDVVGVL